MMQNDTMNDSEPAARTIIAIVPLVVLLAPSYIRTLIAVLKKQPDAYASILIFLPVILLLSTVIMFAATMLGTPLATLLARRLYFLSFSSCLPDAWPTHLLLGVGGTWVMARATRKEGDDMISGWLDSVLCMLLSVSITAASSMLADFGAWVGFNLAAFALDLQDPESALGGLSFVPGVAELVYLICGTVIPWIVLAVLLCKVVAKAAVKHKAKEQWLEVESGAERYQDDEPSEQA